MPDRIATLLARSYLALDRLIDDTIVLSYTSVGYNLRRTLMWDPTDLDVDLSNKVCAITGANSGIGYAVAYRLAQRHAIVYLLARNQVRGEAARSAIVEWTGNTNVYLEAIDLGDLSSVSACAERLLQQTNRLDILINNAGAEFKQRQLSIDGIELTFATNVVGPFLLTHALIPVLKQSAPARIINVASGGMYTQRLDVNDLQFERKRYDGLIAYAQAKRAQVILTELWAQRLTDTGVTVNAMHPGWADTPIVRSGLPTFRAVLRSVLRTPDQGADTIVWLAVAPHLGSISGSFWFDRRERSTHKVAMTESPDEDGQRLWNECEKLIQKAGFGIHGDDSEIDISQ